MMTTEPHASRCPHGWYRNVWNGPRQLLLQYCSKGVDCWGLAANTRFALLAAESAAELASSWLAWPSCGQQLAGTQHVRI